MKHLKISFAVLLAVGLLSSCGWLSNPMGPSPAPGATDCLTPIPANVKGFDINNKAVVLRSRAEFNAYMNGMGGLVANASTLPDPCNFSTEMLLVDGYVLDGCTGPGVSSAKFTLACYYPTSIEATFLRIYLAPTPVPTPNENGYVPPAIICNHIPPVDGAFAIVPKSSLPVNFLELSNVQQP